MAGDETRQIGSFRGGRGVRSHRAEYAICKVLKVGMCQGTTEEFCTRKQPNLICILENYWKQCRSRMNRAW